MPERFADAWGDGITLIGVSGLTDLTATDSIGLWPSYASYVGDTIPNSSSSPRRTFASAAAALNYASGFPAAVEGHSMAWNGSGNVTDASNWVASEAGTLSAIASQQTTIEGGPINSTNDRGNPGVLPVSAAASGLLITEIMFAPASPLATVGYTDNDFEWAEIYNNTGAAINFEASNHVFDDDDGGNIAAANLTMGILAAGEIGILFNSARITEEDMQTMWGASYNYIPVTPWPALNNSGAETIAIWPSYAAYNSEPIVDSGRTHENAISAVTYNTASAQGWPTVNNQSSIWLTNLSGDPNTGANWRRAGAAGDLLSHQAAGIFDTLVDHEGGDVGSPGFAPGSVSVGIAGDYNNNGAVDAADYVVWRDFLGTVSSLPNDPHAGTTIDTDQYATWAANFGKPALASAASVPEPAGLVMVLFILAIHGMRRSS
jgi:hypothetical protein